MGAALAILAASLTLDPAPTAASLGLRPSYPRPGVASAPSPAKPHKSRGALKTNSEQLLELWVDGRNRGVVARVVEEGGQFLVATADLTAAGLKGGTGPMTPLSAVGVTDVQVVTATQQLLLTTQAGPERQVLDLRGTGSYVTPRSDTGFVVRYDLSGVFGERFGGWSAAAALAGSVFTPRGRLDATGWMRADEDVARFIRLDTAVELNDAERMRRVVVGDSVSSQLPWSRSVRFAGVQVARDFSLQPDLVTLPTIDFLGKASAPSNVDVFVNAARVYTGKVEPGPFEVRDIPVVTGSGEAVIVVRDVLGRAVSTTLPLYASDDLLAEGLTDYSLEAGVLRRAYGLKSFVYDEPVATATVRRGISDRLTAQAHFEASPDVAVAGGGATFAMGAAGVASANLAASANGGLLYALSFEREGKWLRLYGAAAGTSGRFEDLAAAYEAFDVPDLRLQFGAAFDVGRRGAAGLSWISERSGRREIELATASYSYTLPGGWYFGTSGLYDQGRDEWAGQVFLRMPLTNAVSATASADVGGKRQRSSYSLSRRADPDGGVGYALTATPDDDRYQAEAVWFADKAAGSAAILSADGETAGRALVSGAVVGLDGGLYATRGVGGAMALVKTGYPGVQVYRENRPVGVTGKDGRVLLAGLTPNSRNRIGVKLTDFPFAAELPASMQEVAPQARSGVIVDFTPTISHPVMLVVRLANGAFPPAGSRLVLDGYDPIVVGRRGEAFVRDLTGPASGWVRHAGGACQVAVSPPTGSPGDSIPRLDTACREAAP